jgi:hypothetical protein
MADCTRLTAHETPPIPRPGEPGLNLRVILRVNLARIGRDLPEEALGLGADGGGVVAVVLGPLAAPLLGFGLRVSDHLLV